MRGVRIFLSANDPILNAGASILESMPETAEAVATVPAVVEPPVAAPKKRNKAKKVTKVTKVVKTKKTKKTTKVKKDGRGRPRVYSDADLKKVGKLVAKLSRDGEGRAAKRAMEILHAKTGNKATLRKAAGFDKALKISMPWILKANNLYGAELPLGRPKLAA